MRRVAASALATTERPTATNGGVKRSASSRRRATALCSGGARFAEQSHARSSAAAAPETPGTAKASEAKASASASRDSSGVVRRSSFVARSRSIRSEDDALCVESVRVDEQSVPDPNPPGAPRVIPRNAARVTTSADVTSRAVVVAA